MLSKETLQRLQAAVEEPDLEGTRYSIIERVGHGGMGSVFLAEDCELKRKVALKVMNLVDTGDLAHRMQKEAQIVARLEHPGIVPVHDVGTLPDGRVFYVMKFVQGNRLDDYRNKNVAQSELLRLFKRICEAVAFANAHGVIHRDLKPQNIMVGPFGEVLVMDWGVAKVLNHPEYEFYANESSSTSDKINTQHGTVIGTPGYMSPEQSRGETDLDQRTDVFSLGAILFFLLTGKDPPQSSSNVPAELRATIPKRLAAICRKAMAVSSTDRYSGVSDLANDIERFFDHQPILAYRENVFEKTARWVDRYRFVVYLVATYLLLRFLVFLFVNR